MTEVKAPRPKKIKAPEVRKEVVDLTKKSVFRGVVTMTTKLSRSGIPGEPATTTTTVTTTTTSTTTTTTVIPLEHVFPTAAKRMTRFTEDVDWATTRQAPADQVLAWGATGNQINATRSQGFGVERSTWRVFMAFDLSGLSLPTIVAARIEFEPSFIQTGSETTKIVCAQGPSTFNSSDYAFPLGTPLFAGPSANCVLDTPQELEFSAAGVAYLNAQSSGIAYLAFLEYDHDWLNVDPAGPTTRREIAIYGDTVGKKPKLLLSI